MKLTPGFLKAIVAFLLLISKISITTAHAGVSLKNGDFYISYTDVTIGLPAGITFELDRTYNSLATTKGLFGIGWGSPLETFIKVLGDGNIVVYENGSGGKTVFRQPVLDISQMEQMVEQILTAMRRAGDLKDLNAALSERQKLHEDEELRATRWNSYVQKGLLLPRYPEFGTIFINADNRRHGATERLIYFPDGFRRYQQDRIEIFNSVGQLIRIEYSLHGFSLELERDSQGRLQKLIYPNGALHFFLNPDGTVSRIKAIGSDGLNNRESLYFYQKGNLIITSDIDVNYYEYDYDDNSNMLSITYVDGSAMLMTYHGNGMIRSVTPRNKPTTWYSYGDLYQDNDKHGYFTEVQHPEGNRDRHEYHERRNAYGRWLIVKIRTTVAGITTEAEYTPEGQLRQVHGGPWPVRVERDSLGRPVLIVADDIMTHIAYDRHNRIVALARQPVDAPTPTERRNFAYNLEGRLIQVTGGSDEKWTLNYTGDCLTALISDDQTLEMVCNASNLPTSLRFSQNSTFQIEIHRNLWGVIEAVSAKPAEAASVITKILRDLVRLTQVPIDIEKKIVGIECLQCELPDVATLLVFPERTQFETIIKHLELAKPAP